MLLIRPCLDWANALTTVLARSTYEEMRIGSGQCLDHLLHLLLRVLKTMLTLIIVSCCCSTIRFPFTFISQSKKKQPPPRTLPYSLQRSSAYQIMFVQLTTNLPNHTRTHTQAPYLSFVL